MDETTKTCIGCFESKPIGSFPIHSGKYRRTRCGDCFREYNTAMKKNNYSAAVNEKRVLRNYNITAEQYWALAAEQDFCCAICGMPETRERDGKISALAVDHDHDCCPGQTSCGKCIRGLLCFRCNAGVGLFSDNPTILEYAGKYLREWYEGRDRS